VADLAARLVETGVRTAILTHGFDDEMDVHRVLAPGAQVLGGRDRVSLARTVAGEGAQIGLLDSGFQHRKLHRDLDILTIDEASAAGSMAYLPAGPFRESLAAVARADLVVVVSRPPASEGISTQGSHGLAARGRSRLRELEDASGAPPFLSARILPGPLVAANESARASDAPRPTVAVAGVMWPEVFFAQVGPVAAPGYETVRLRDHARVDRALGERLRGLAGQSGLVCTLKDSMKLVRVLGDSIPVWYLSESVVWDEAGVPPTLVRAALALLDQAAPDSIESPAP
jgi:tetraacyldisaccharide 4'-kinase